MKVPVGTARNNEVEGNIRIRGESKLTSFPTDHTLSVLVIYLDFPLIIEQKQTNKDGARATTAQLYPGRNTFEFDQGHVTENRPITVLV